MTETPMTFAEVLALLRCSERTLRDISRKDLPWAKPGAERLYLPSAVARYIEARSQPKPKKEKRPSPGSQRSPTPRTGKRGSPTPAARDGSFRSLLEKDRRERPASAPRN